MKKEIKIFIEDILESIEYIEEYVSLVKLKKNIQKFLGRELLE